MFTSQTDRTFNMLLPELPLELLTAIQKNKLCNPGTLRSYPRTMAFATMDSSLVVSTGVPSVALSSSSTEPAIPALLFPTSAPAPEKLDGCTSGAVTVPDPEDVEGLTSVATILHDSGDVDGSTCVAEGNAETSGEGKRTLVTAHHGKSSNSVEDRDERKFLLAVTSLTRKSFPTKVAVQLEPGDIENRWNVSMNPENLKFPNLVYFLRCAGPSHKESTL